jgi:hypothetical protein
MTHTQTTAPRLGSARQELAKAIADMNVYLMKDGSVTAPEYCELKSRLGRAQRRVDRLTRGPV